jgi:6-pyruvoyltetrahydropterin/6-carboxytetrahydropterin synthase
MKNNKKTLAKSFLVERKIEIDAGHRISSHGSQCRNLHGHRYTIIAVCSGPLVTSGEQQGMVLDFEFLRDEMLKQIHEACDHTMILWIEDPLAQKFIDDRKRFDKDIRPAVLKQGYYRTDHSTVGALYIMDGVPTAENLAAHWFHRLQPVLRKRTRSKADLHQIKVFETPNCVAIYPVR